jgi:hypothetical protein
MEEQSVFTEAAHWHELTAVDVQCIQIESISLSPVGARGQCNHVVDNNQHTPTRLNKEVIA